MTHPATAHLPLKIEVIPTCTCVPCDTYSTEDKLVSPIYWDVKIKPSFNLPFYNAINICSQNVKVKCSVKWSSMSRHALAWSPGPFWGPD